MEDFRFYVQLGLDHVLDFSAYDHILFLCALAVPFTFKQWRSVVLLATVFTVTHCLSLFLSVFEIVTVAVSLIEFLIPVTIFLTALMNVVHVWKGGRFKNMAWDLGATAFFGLVHGFGFSNYFKMLVAGQEEKMGPLLAFALGIEISQVTIVLLVLLLAFLVCSVLKVRPAHFIVVASSLIVLVTIPLLWSTFPW